MAWNEPSGNGNKDPWGHRKNEQGPPDLDEIFKKWQEKLKGLFGGKPSGNGSDDNVSIGVIGAVLVMLLLVWGSFGFYTIQPAEQGIETYFGSYSRTTQQGLNWHIPYPIEAVQKINVEQMRAVTHKALMLTQDENMVEIELVVQYNIKPDGAKDYLFKVRDPDNTLHQATESALREVIGNGKMDEVLTGQRDRVASDTKKSLQNILDRYETGLLVASVNMQNAQPPEAVQDAFADVIKAREDEERIKNKAQAYANEIRQRAGGYAEKLRQEAQAYKAQVIARAEGETQRFISILNEYNKAPEITRKRIYLESMETVMSSTSKVLMDTKHGNNIMYLPLDRLMGNSNIAAPQSSPSVANNNPPPPPAAPAEERPRDGRSRDQDDSRSRGTR
jgi:membrane protease subunit HflK